MPTTPPRPTRPATQPVASTSRLDSPGLGPALGLVAGSGSSRVNMAFPAHGHADLNSYGQVGSAPASPSRKKQYGDRSVRRADGGAISGRGEELTKRASLAGLFRHEMGSISLQITTCIGIRRLRLRRLGEFTTTLTFSGVSDRPPPTCLQPARLRSDRR